METRNINIGVGKTITIQFAGHGFRFESGTSTTSDKYIIVKTSQGNSIAIKPGQAFRASDQNGDWTITANDQTAAITGRIAIYNADEDFQDSNVFTAISLDASLVNNVRVNNTVADPVNVISADSAMAYTNSYFTNWETIVNTGQVQIISAAANVNGVIVEYAEISSGCNAGMITGKAMLKADGALLLGLQVVTSNITTATSENVMLPKRIKIPAGTALTMETTKDSGSTIYGVVSVLYTVL